MNAELVKALRWLANETEFVFAQEQLRAAASEIDRLTAENARLKSQVDIVDYANEACLIRIAELEAKLAASRRREGAAVEIVTRVGRTHRLCGFCEGEGDRCKRDDFGGCSFDWRGPVAGRGEAE